MISATRRQFMAGTAAAVTAVATAQVAGARAAAGAATGGTLVHVFLHGGLDGLSLVAPAKDPVLATLRPNLLLGSDSLPLPRGFRLTGAFKPLASYLGSGHLAFIPGVSDPRISRSHFQAQDVCHLGGLPGETDGRGWLDALVNLLGGGTVLRGVAIGATLPRSLVGTGNAAALTAVDSLRLDGDARYADATAEALRGLFTGIDHPAEHTVRSALAAVETARRVAPPADAAGYDGAAGAALRQVARLIKGGAGVRVATVAVGGFDTHENQGTGPGGYLYGRLNDLATALAAFFDDLGDRRAEVTVMISSEFGRRVAENGRGCDHGHGGVISVLSGRRLAGPLLGAWDGLAELDNGDVPEFTNMFDVFGSVAQGRFALTTGEVQQMFPHRRFTPIELYA
ncbi:DUF1501 domain-containing protein [Rhizomonospora bruguierae]|uniref:DUF1501 domain-containing protein n=1 Tax=Rhizomonospora bruguierae TaxID=1581705 RepID=UPI001BCC0871|nr:DUF1501 domain-containing protein [Micromonospora sp. NBRC 107566]